MATTKKLPTGIRLKKNGRYEVRLMYEGKNYSTCTDTLTEAKKAKAELIYKLNQGLFVEKKHITFGEWFNVWLN